MNNIIAVVRDGHSDSLVLKQFMKTLLSQHKVELGDDNFYEFKDLKLVDIIDKYKLNYGEKGFIDDIASILFVSFEKLLKEKETITNNDIIILNSDSEKVLGERKKYFEDWAYNVNHNLWKAADVFYEKMVSAGYNYKNLPLVIPLVLFPCSEILVASCMYDFQRENCRKMKPKPELKYKVYESDNIPEVLNNGYLKDVLDTYIIPEHIESIYREIPEARRLIHILSATYN